MIFNKVNVETFLQELKNNKICNNGIIKFFSNYLPYINFDEVSKNRSHLEIGLCKNLTIPLTASIQLESESQKCIKLIFNCRKDYVGIEIGNAKMPYNEYNEYKTEKELQIFEENMGILFKEQIIEIITILENGKSKSEYYYCTNKIKKMFFSEKNNFFKGKVLQIKENIYEPWIKL